MFEFYLENENGAIVNINDASRYAVIKADGLNPPSASLFTAKSPNRKGSKHNGSTLDERVITLTIRLRGDIEANRNALYEWVETEQYVKVRYRNGLKNVYAEGYVQDCPIDLFTEQEEVVVTILCGDPYWKDLQEIVTDISNTLSLFKFPFAIDSEGVPFSTVRDSNTTRVFNDGAETGIIIRIRCKGDIKNFTFYNANDTTQIFSLKTTLAAGWLVEIDTDGTPKRCRAILADGSTINLVKYISGRPTWFTLKKGNNLFGYTAESGLDNAEVSISFVNKYTGV